MNRGFIQNFDVHYMYNAVSRKWCDVDERGMKFYKALTCRKKREENKREKLVENDKYIFSLSFFFFLNVIRAHFAITLILIFFFIFFKFYELKFLKLLLLLNELLLQLIITNLKCNFIIVKLPERHIIWE